MKCPTRALVPFLIATSLAAIDHTQPLRAYNAGDYNKAFQLWMQDAKLGEADAQYHIALLYRDGKGISKDLAEAVRWLRLSAEHGFDPGQTELGWFLSKGMGTPTDHVEARKWYEKAIVQGNVPAKNLLGILYLNGRGVPQDYGRAYKLFLEASGASSSAAYNVGLMHERGWGRPPNLVEAGAWYSIAADNGGSGAKEKRDEIIRKLSPTENYAMRSRARNIGFDRFLSQLVSHWEEGLSALVVVLIILQLGLSWLDAYSRKRRGNAGPELDLQFSKLTGNWLRRWLLLYRPQGILGGLLHFLFYLCLLATIAVWMALFVPPIGQDTFIVAVCLIIVLLPLRWAAMSIDKIGMRKISGVEAKR